MPKCMGCIGTQVSEFVLDLCVSAGWWLGNCWEVVGLKTRVVLLKLAAKCLGACQEGCYQ